MVVKNSKSKFFIRISGDSPLIDHRSLIELLKFIKENYDLITNISFFRQSAEITELTFGKILKLD